MHVCLKQRVFALNITLMAGSLRGVSSSRIIILHVTNPDVPFLDLVDMPGSAMLGQRGLQECWGSAQRWTESLAGVCPTLAHLD